VQLIWYDTENPEHKQLLFTSALVELMCKIENQIISFVKMH